MKKVEELNVTEIIEMFNHAIKMAESYNSQANNYAFSPDEEGKKHYQEYTNLRDETYAAVELLDNEFKKRIRFILKK